MAIVWKINGTALSELTLSRLMLTLENQQADRLSFDDPRAAFDGVLTWAIDSAIVLTREVDADPAVTWFRGVIRETPRTAEGGIEGIGYAALGPWDWLVRTPYLQSFKTPVDPDDPGSSLTTYLRGRAVLAQDDDGDKVNVGEFLNEVMDYAIAATTAHVGSAVMQRDDFSAVAGLDFFVPWDEVTDLYCAEAISRLLQSIPDAVAWWDYATNPPTMKIGRRGALDALDLPIERPDTDVGDDFETAVRAGFRLRERPDLQRDGVVLIYTRTNRANSAQWETYETDIHPPGTLPNRPNVLVRTIRLAGAQSESNTFAQRVETDALSASLVYGSSAWLTSGSQFATLSAFWLAHAPELNRGAVSIKGFAVCARTGDTSLPRELVKGAITDWMVANSSIDHEEQTISAYIAYEETKPNDATKKARHIRHFVARVVATNAQTQTYSQSEALSFTPPEETPVGLAEAIHAAISPLHYDGSVELVEREATVRDLMGRVLNVTGGLAAWETMRALIQRAEIDIQRGGTRLTVGPPKQLGPDDLVELYRVNRDRQPVTSYYIRNNGTTGSAANVVGFGVDFPGGAKGAGASQPPSRYTAAITVAGLFPTSAEMTAAVLSAYTSNNIPVEGDILSLTVGGLPRFQTVVTLTNVAPSGWEIVSFTFSGVTYYAWSTQTGIL